MFISCLLLGIAGYVFWFALGLTAVGAPLLALAGLGLILLNYYRYSEVSSLPSGGAPFTL